MSVREGHDRCCSSQCHREDLSGLSRRRAIRASDVRCFWAGLELVVDLLHPFQLCACSNCLGQTTYLEDQFRHVKQLHTLNLTKKYLPVLL